MPAMTIRNISVEAHRALKKRAAARGVSAEAEVRAMLEAAVPAEPRKGLGTLLQEFGKKYGPLPEVQRSKETTDPAIFE
jgi:plasmid stability protein